MPDPAPAAPDQFTYEEWVEATQACCGLRRPDDGDEPRPEPTAKESP